MKKKVLHIISSTQWRGGEQQVSHILNYSSSTVEYFLFCPKKAQIIQRNPGKKASIYTYKKRFGLDILASWELKKVCKQHQIDFIHLHDSHAINTYLLADLLGMDIPAVVHRHVNFPIVSKWKYNYHKIKRIICVSNAVKNSFTSFIASEKLIVLHPCIEVSRFSQVQCTTLRTEINATEGQQIIGIVAAVEKEKNITMFLNIAYQYSQKQLPHQFVIIGDGSLMNSFKTQYILSNVHFLGFRENIEQLLPDMDVFLFTSVKEGFPLVLLEAMAAGVPVISNHFESVGEIISFEKNGFIVNTETEAIEKLDCLLTTTHAREAIIKNARTFVQAFDIKNMNQQLEIIYKKL